MGEWMVFFLLKIVEILFMFRYNIHARNRENVTVWDGLECGISNGDGNSSKESRDEFIRYFKVHLEIILLELVRLDLY